MRLAAAALSGLALALSTATSLIAQEAFPGAVTYRMTVEGRSIVMKVASRGGTTRMEMEGQGMPGTMVMLMDSEKKVMQLIVAAAGMYMETDLNQAAERVPEAKRRSAAESKAENLGTADEIAGIRCENYLLTQPGEPDSEGCIATGMGYWMGGMSPPKNSRSPASSMGPDLSAYMKDFKDGMMPLRLRTREGTTWVTMMEATAVERTPLDASLFTLPPGLRKMAMPGGE